jgi:hypothetical protein
MRVHDMEGFISLNAAVCFPLFEADRVEADRGSPRLRRGQ